MFSTPSRFSFRRFLAAQRLARRAEGAGGRRFELLVDEHLDAIYRTARRLGIREDDIEDLVQEVLVVIARRLDDIEVDKERAFALGTTARIAAGFRRRAHRRLEALVEEVEAQTSSARPLSPSLQISGEERLEYAEALDVLRRGLDAMTEAQRVTFVLFELEEMRATEIAAELGVAVAAVERGLPDARPQPSSPDPAAVPHARVRARLCPEAPRARAKSQELPAERPGPSPAGAPRPRAGP